MQRRAGEETALLFFTIEVALLFKFNQLHFLPHCGIINVNFSKEVGVMGIYLNPGNDLFQEALNSEIYIDKSMLISYTNKKIRTKDKNLCVSRPRRFGKSMAADMLVAYYSRGCDSKEQFENLKIAKNPDFEKHLNQYNVIHLNMQNFLSKTQTIEQMIALITKAVGRDLLRAYPDVDYLDKTILTFMLDDIYQDCQVPFIFIIDEWDCIFREYKSDKEAQEQYLDFLRDFLKDKSYINLAYMTGILPVKKYGTHSALNMFDEFSMTNPKYLASYVGFTEAEVKKLCEEYHMELGEIRNWYDGYSFEEVPYNLYDQYLDHNHIERIRHSILLHNDHFPFHQRIIFLLILQDHIFLHDQRKFHCQVHQVPYQFPRSYHLSLKYDLDLHHKL